MVKIRADKINKIADYIPLQELENGSENSDLLVVGWGSTFGAIKTATRELSEEDLTLLIFILNILSQCQKIWNKFYQIMKDFGS